MIISPFPQPLDLELYRIHITSTTTVPSNDRMLRARIALTSDLWERAYSATGEDVNLTRPDLFHDSAASYSKAFTVRVHTHKGSP